MRISWCKNKLVARMLSSKEYFSPALNWSVYPFTACVKAILLCFTVFTVTIFTSIPSIADQELITTRISGTEGDDVINNAAPVDASAVIDTSLSETVKTFATGIDALGGDDLIQNAAGITSGASSTADVDEVIAPTVVEASGVGVTGGAGEDEILNTADIDITAGAQALTLDAVLPVIGDGVLDVSTTAAANSAGITGDEDADSIDSTGLIDLVSASDSKAVGISLKVDGIVIGDGSARVLGNASATADARAVGIAGGSGIDGIYSRAGILVNLFASATTVDAGILIEVTEDAIVSGVTLSDSSALAVAWATGLSGDSGADTLYSDGDIVFLANADATSVGVTLTIAGTAEGNATGTALTDTRAIADVATTGIAGGAGNDFIDNRSSILAEARATSTGVGVGTEVGIVVEQGGDVSGAALSDARATASVIAKGIDGDADIDVIENEGDIGLLANAQATGVSVSLAVEGTMGGDAAGKAVSDARVMADAAVTGIDGGGDGDVIISEGNLGQLLAGSNATGVAASLDIAGTVTFKSDAQGEVAGTALSDSRVGAWSIVNGLSGGTGSDMIENYGDLLLLQSNATATGVAAGLNIAAGVGFKGDLDADVSGAAVSDARVIADAAVTGIDGGSDADTIINEGILGQLLAGSTATGVAANLDIAGVVAFKSDAQGEVDGSALSDASVDALAAVTGINGGTGGDTIENYDDLLLLQSNATATGVAAGLNVSAGVGFKGDLDVDVSGAAVSDARVTADATVTGLDGGSGGNTIINEGELVQLLAGSTATGVAASLDIAGSITFKGDAESEISGTALSDASVDALASVFGIDGGASDDTIENFGDLTLLLADATATGVSASLNVSAGVSVKGNLEADVSGVAVSDASALAESLVSGIEGAGGQDMIINEGNLGQLRANSTATGVAASLDISGVLTVKGTATGAAAGTAVSNASATAIATVMGIHAGEGDDTIENGSEFKTENSGDFAELIAYSNATGVAASLDITAGVGIKGVAIVDVEGAALSDASATAEATATALDGGAGNDIIDNTGDLKRVRAVSDATGVAASLAINGTMGGDTAGAAVSDSSATATTAALGIGGGDGADTITNEGLIAAGSAAEADAVSVSADVSIQIGVGGESTGSALSDASATAIALATGIDAGEGDDSIVNEGAIFLMQEDQFNADAAAVAVGFTIATGGLAAEVTGKALSDSSALADAAAWGIAGGLGEDHIENHGMITADVGSKATTTAVSAAFSLTTVGGTTTGAALSDASATALAMVAGIDGGKDNDWIENDASIDVTAGSSAEAVAVSVSLVAGAVQESAAGKAVADASADAVSYSTGIDGGSGDDTLVTATKKITAAARAQAESDSVSVGIQAGTGGFVELLENASVADSSARGEASATGIEGGSGNDSITNSSEIEATSLADADVTATSVTVGFTMGAAGNFGTADSSATAVANATGIEGGEQDDEIDNTGILTVGAAQENLGTMANAEANSTTVDVGIAVGYVTGTATSDASATAEATAAGISGGAGDNTITNSDTGTVTVGPGSGTTGPLALAKAEGTTVKVGITVGASEGGMGGVSSDASATAVVDLAGILGGTGVDWIENSGALVIGAAPDSTLPLAKAMAASETVEVALTLGLSLGDATSNASATATSITTGIETDLGDDWIDNSGQISAVSVSEAVGIGKTTKVSLTVGVSEGTTQSDASSFSTARSTGIDSGGDADTITTDSEMFVKARSASTSISTAKDYNVLSIGAAIQSAVANSSSTAEAIATGIDGGGGGDTITAGGSFDLVADALVSGSSRSSSIAGVTGGESAQMAQSRTETIATSLAVGIDGGGGDDTITSTATMDLSAYAEAFAKAISSTNSGLNIAGASSGESIADAATTVTATAIGIRGGAAEPGVDETDADVITSDGPISVSSTVSATTESTSTADSLTVFGSAEGAAVSDASAHVVATATGIYGGADNDVITSRDSLTVTSTSDSSVTSTSNVDADVVFGDASSKGASDASANMAVEALAIDGGSGADVITSQGVITVVSTSTGSVKSVSNVDADVTFGSASSKGASDASTNVTARALAIDGGSGADIITSHDILMVTATSTGSVDAASNVNADVTFGSASSGAASDASAFRRADALGITGGDGADEITNYASLFINALSDGSVKSDAHANADSTFGSASSSTVTAAAIEGTAVTFGIAGGGEGDTISNQGTIDSVATAILTVTSSSISISDSTFGDAYAAAASVSSAEGKASATGISGDAGNDVIENAGMVNSTASSTTTVDSVTVALADSTFGSANTVARSANFAAGEVLVRGITAGAGNDVIRNADLVTVVADNSVTVTSLTVSGSGPASSDAETRALTYAHGLDGGAGADSIDNQNTIFVKAMPRILSATRTFGREGYVDGKVGILLDAVASGVSGGAGDDVINNTGDVLAFIGSPENDSMVSLDAAAGAMTFTDTSFIPDAPTDPQALAGKWLRFSMDGNPDFFARIVGYDTGTGTFTLRDPLPYDLPAGVAYTLYDYGDKQADITSVAVTAGGNAFVDASTTASIQAQGITGGEGDDQLSNSGAVAVSASNLVKAVTVTVTRNIVADTRVESSVNAVGIAGNDQSDTSDRSAGGTSIFTDLSRKGDDPDAIIGQHAFFESGASAGFTSVVSGFDPDTGTFTLSDMLPSGGVARGDSYTLGGGSDFISNDGSIDVAADGVIDASSWSLDFGSANIEARGLARTDAAGIRGGGFSDLIQNDGDISARSTAAVSSSDRVLVVFGSADQELFFEASSESAGVETGAGDDEFFNADNGSINAEAVSTAAVDGVTAVLFANITNSVDAIADSTALGVDLGEGKNIANTAGELTSSSLAIVVATAISEVELGETDADADAIANATARGILAGSNEDQVFNRDLMEVSASADATSTAAGARVGNKDETSSVTEDGNTDDNFFFDASLIPAEDEQPVDIVGEWIRFTTGENEDFFARVNDFDPATGKLILNKSLVGDLQAEEVDPDTGEIITPADLYVRSAARDGTSTATAAASAIGINLGDGNAVVGNEGILNVHAVAIADTTASAFGGAAVASAEATANARGIVTGDGDDVVGNDDVITVTAEILTQAAGTGVTEIQSATARGIDTGAGVDTVLNEGDINVTVIAELMGATVDVIGISTGDGDDIFLNAGTGSIAASTVIAGITAPATAISTGAGQDLVSLLDQSGITGHIDLGPDDDLLTLADAATVVGGVTGGTGTDTLRIEDRGTFALTAPVEMERLEVNQGILEFTGDYLFPADGFMQAEIYNPDSGDLGHGQLVINGETGLDGTATVTALPRIYTDGEALPLLSAESIGSEAEIPTGFATVTLPPDSALVSFGYDYRFGVAGRDLFEVTTAVDPFRAVARNSLQRALAGYLQRIAPAASGDLAEVIGTFQLLPSGSDFDTAFSSLSPDTHDNYTQATFYAVSQYDETLSLHMRAQRIGRMAPGAAARQSGRVTDRPLLLAYDGDISGVGSLYADEEMAVPAWWRYVWGTAFGQWGDQDGDNGYTGFDYNVGGLALGIDRYVNDRLLLGASAAYTSTDVDQDKGRGNGDIDGWMASLYSSYSFDKAYVDGAVSYGRNDYDAKREVRVGTIKRTARSDHDGDVIAASLGGGYLMPVKDSVLEPFGRLQYIRLDEDAFTESGASSVNQRISSRDTDSLISEIGVRISRSFPQAGGRLTTDASVAWLHDFDIDDRTITTSYTGVPASSFSVPGQDVESNGVTLGLGVGFETSKGVSTSLNYNGEFRDGFSAHGIIGRISYRF